MKNSLAIALISALIPSLSFANCGSIPDAPELLEEAQVTTQQLSDLDTQMNSYTESIVALRSCIDDQIANLAPANATAEFFDSQSYQDDFQDLVNYSDLAEQAMNFSVERFNFLLENANSQ